MRVAVTGVAGNVGSHVARELAAYGHDVAGVDMYEPEVDLPLTSFERVNMEDGPEVVRAFAGCDAVVHLAGVSRPGLVADREMFRINTMGTYNALEAAVVVGARRLVFASSEAVLGFTTLSPEVHPAYVPIDEDHPLRPAESYGLSKQLGEEMCRSYANRGVISTVALRTCYVWSLKWRRNAIEGLVNEERSRRSLWAYIDARDAAVAYRLACEAPNIEHETLFVVARDSGTTTGSIPDLLAAHHPTAQMRKLIGPTDSVVSGERANRILGFTAQHSWREQLSPDDLRAS